MVILPADGVSCEKTMEFFVSFCSVLVSVATVNEYALKGLDKMEEKLPILHQPADKVK